ncbi:MAG: cytidylate kinase-like family protein [Porphyromonadaceae bacterium]|nr:MAG: cytidylate kinase-like family protein [Porphyromonadaceae bacterium]
MENLLIKYFEARIKNETKNKEPGPVITISREYGCPSKVLAGIVVDKLRSLDQETPAHPYRWRWISREVLEESAKDLKVDPRHINHIFDYQERSIIDDILASTRKDGSYKSDHAIKKSVGKVIRSMGEHGHVVIVGRAGVVLNRDIKKSLHIRLMAPLEWRINSTMQMQNLPKDKALEMIISKDANRKRFLEYYLGQKFQIQIFDTVYNCAYLTLEEIADSIVYSAGQRKMI